MKNILLVFTAIIISFSCQRQASDKLAPKVVSNETKFYNQNKEVPKHEKGVVLFKLKNNSSLSRVAGRSTTERVFTKAMQKAGDNGFYKVRIKDEIKAVNELKSNPDVEWASLNYAEHTMTTPDDPHWTNGNLWGLANINMPQVWQSGNFGNKQVYVGVIDEGIFGHEDLCVNIWKNPYELDNGIDDDGNGYIDDFNGWDWFNNDNQVYPGAIHGTHVAGTIGAKNNQTGVIGVAPNVTLISCKFLEQYGYDEGAIKAIDYLIDLKQRHGLNIKVTSNSWGGGGFNPGLLEAIQRARDADILFIAAAGNHSANNDLQDNYPSNYNVDNIIAVGASQWDNSKASFSCFGATTVDIFAPGTGVLSTIPNDNHTSGYAFFSGTSMATPHVSGAAALYAGIHTDASYLQIKQAILNAAKPVPALQGLCVTNGMLDVSTLTGQTQEHQSPVYPCPELNPDNTPPSIPQNLDVYEVGFDPREGAFYGGYFGVRWDRSTDPEGGAVGYIVFFNDVPAWYVTGNNYVFAGFTDTTTDIVVKVYAQDSWGNVSGFSNSDTAIWNQTPQPPDTQAPSIPQNLSVTNATTTSLKLNWSASNDNVGVTSYVINWGVGQTNLQTTVTGTTNTFSNLIPNTTYHFNVQAKDAAGNVSNQSTTVSGTTLTDAPPPSFTINAALSGAATQTLPVTLTFTVNTNGTIQSTEMERRRANETTWTVISNNATSPFFDSPPTQGNPNYFYRLKVTLTNGQVGYSNEKQVQVKKK